MREGEGEREKLITGQRSRRPSGIWNASLVGKSGCAVGCARSASSGASSAEVARLPPAESPASTRGEARKPSAWLCWRSAW